MRKNYVRGTLVEAYDYDAYGNTLIFTATGSGSEWWADDAAQSLTPTCETLFCGYRYDPETEIYCVRRRYYAPQWGRWISRDPVMTLVRAYLYVKSRPIRVRDPLGLWEDDGIAFEIGDPFLEILFPDNPLPPLAWQPPLESEFECWFNNPIKFWLENNNATPLPPTVYSKEINFSPKELQAYKFAPQQMLNDLYTRLDEAKKSLLTDAEFDAASIKNGSQLFINMCPSTKPKFNIYKIEPKFNLKIDGLDYKGLNSMEDIDKLLNDLSQGKRMHLDLKLFYSF